MYVHKENISYTCMLLIYESMILFVDLRSSSVQTLQLHVNAHIIVRNYWVSSAVVQHVNVCVRFKADSGHLENMYRDIRVGVPSA